MKAPRYILMGASLDTGNMGVSALFASTVKCILDVHPDAMISVMEGTRGPYNEWLDLGDGRVVRVPRLGVRQNKTFWRPNHVLRLLCTAVMLRLVPVASWRRRLLSCNPYLKALAEAEYVADITGGDSFSDIYGMRRLLLGTLHKLLAIAVGADLVLLPQTYGPFRGRMARTLARCVLRRAVVILSRDEEGLQAVGELMGQRLMQASPQFCPDVAFLLPKRPPGRIRTVPGPLPDQNNVTLIGLNVSGLLYNGGYNRRNMFGLRCDYPALMRDLAQALLAADRTAVLLLPHVFSPEGDPESDPEACRRIYNDLVHQHRGRLFLLEGEYDQSEVKHIIGLCEFFVGSRMHACIAAASQGIPTVPLAYSRKFKGVFDSIGSGELVGDLCDAEAPELVQHALAAYHRREEIADHLRRTIPLVIRRVLSLFPTQSSLADKDSAVGSVTAFP